jgi:hypothetical protein
MKHSQDSPQTGAHPEYEIVGSFMKLINWTPLHETTVRNDLPGMKYLLELGEFNINAVTKNSNMTSLHQAVR